ncbi:Rrf2 family transcriptional regulator [Brevundimonas sp.]|uniref:RrF2 family transcriptional regulator n=1 Tax=Brevundimonas sp. TaxID=1871086 RepID=UPI0025EB8E40|nr:Rrf2 family transcriptional regulator [Brevundimonas sp.]
MLSNKARYALRALMHLAEIAPASASIGTLAETTDAPRKFLEAILLELNRAGLLVSRRGRAGGYALSRPANQISVADVIRVIDGPLALAPCASVTAPGRCSTCPDMETCRLRPALIASRNAVAAVLESWTLAHGKVY